MYSPNMPLKTITFRLPEEKLRALDSVAEVHQRDRSFVINEAVAQYLSLHEYHRSLIEEGVRQDDAGDVVDHETVLKMMADLINKPQKRR
ncbi:MAG: CopG family transcriptional regulator [Acidobacteriaceae bacterium]